MNAYQLLPTLLVVMFMYLKLTKQVDWSWWWVFSPYWIVFLLFIFLFTVSAVHHIKQRKKLPYLLRQYGKKVEEIKRKYDR